MGNTKRGGTTNGIAANKSDPGSTFVHQVMCQPDKDKLKQAMMEKVKTHTKNEHWEVIEKTTVPEGNKILRLCGP